MIPILLIVIVGLVAFLGWAAWSVRSSQQPLTSIHTFSRALEAMGPDSGDPQASDHDPADDEQP